MEEYCYCDSGYANTLGFNSAQFLFCELDK